MTETAARQLSRGMRDLLPGEMDRLRAVEAAFLRACAERGYLEIRTPVIEPLHLFTSAGTLSPQTLEKVYSFLDWDGWSGERVVLRPDSTIPAARLYAEHLDGGRVAKLCYSQNVFRFSDDDSSREEWQCGVELIGETGSAGDLDLLMLALDAIAPLGLGPASVRLSHAGIVRAVMAAAGMSQEEQTVANQRLLDGDPAVIGEIEGRMPQLNAPLHLLFDVEGAGSGYLANVRGALSSAVPGLDDALGELAVIVQALEARGIAPILQAALARNFEYYSGIVFKIDTNGQRICTGGRYDELIGLVGGKRVPASGLGLYVAPIMEQLAATEQSGAIRVLVTAADASPALLAAAQEVGARLRAAGLHVETIDGMETRAERRVVCAEGRCVLDGASEFVTVEELLRALGAA